MMILFKMHIKMYLKENLTTINIVIKNWKSFD